MRLLKAGLSRHAAAEKFAVSASCVIKLMQRYEAKGTIAPGKMGGHMRPVLEPHYTRIRDLIAATSDITIDELRDHLAAEGIAVSRSNRVRRKPQNDGAYCTKERRWDGQVIKRAALRKRRRRPQENR